MKKKLCLGLLLVVGLIISGCNETRLKSTTNVGQIIEFDKGNQVVVDDRVDILLKACPYKYKIGDMDFVAIEVTFKNKTGSSINWTADQATLSFEHDGNPTKEFIKLMTRDELKSQLDTKHFFKGLSSFLNPRDPSVVGRLIEADDNRDARHKADSEMDKVSSILMAETVRSNDSVTRYLIFGSPKNGKYRLSFRTQNPQPYDFDFVIEPDKKS
ncbi:hypothetical protein EB093_04385 [bacterium]|nr:hypothetical protein [bacterium]